ncbi:MAG: DNA polymerase, partial [Bacteroidales bacterium]
YPSVMIDTDFPNPNTLRQNSLNTMHYINNYEGISYVNITCPDNIHYPVLPYRDDDKKKVVFPTGNITGWYCHNEIRYAVEQGYIVNEVYKTQYFTETCAPFKNFIEELYDKRLQYKSEGSKMELVAKLFMNSLYGKFAQKFLDMDNWQHEKTVTEKELQKSKHIERKGCFIRLVQDNKPSHFCIPIWSCYVTAKGRIKMHKAIKENNPVYCDTDSLITKNKLEESNKLGALKMEMKVKEGIIVKPKFYALISQEDEDYVKIKGLGRRISYLCFSDFVSKYNKSIKEYNELGVKIKGTKVFYDKFMKFKEALRRDFMPNEIQDISKEFSLEDDKRKWEKEFDYREFQVSRPIKIKS